MGPVVSGQPGIIVGVGGYKNFGSHHPHVLPTSPVADTEATPMSPVIVITSHWILVQGLAPRR